MFASGSPSASMQATRNLASLEACRSTVSRKGRSTVTFQYPNAAFGKIFDCSVSLNSRKLFAMRAMSSSENSQFFLPRFFRSGLNQAVAEESRQEELRVL